MVNVEEKASQIRPKTSKKKKPKKSSRGDANRSIDNGNAEPKKARKKAHISDISLDVDVEKGNEHDREVGKQTYNDQCQTRRKRDRKQRRNHNDQMASYAESNTGSTTAPSQKYNGRARNHRQQQMHQESYYDNRYDQYRGHGDYMSEMGNHDPIDEYGQDCDSEDEEKEPRFKYSTADLSDGNFRNQKCCLITMGVFFILVAIAVSVIMARKQNS